MLPTQTAYQAWGSATIARRRKTVLISPPGSGKTRMILDAYDQEDLIEQNVPEGLCAELTSSILIVCSGPAQSTWKWQIPFWLPKIDPTDIHVVSGNEIQREKMWARAQIEPGFYIVNNATFFRDYDLIRGTIHKPPHWGLAIFDEYHKYMSSRRSKTFKKIKSLSLKMDNFILTTGTPITKHPGNAWTAFNVVQPRLYGSYWRFVNTWCHVAEGMFGKEILGPKNIDNFKKEMDRNMVYIPEGVVADDLPAGQRSAVSIDMTPLQQQYYEKLCDELMAITESGEIIIAKNSMDRVLKLRQLLCCPELLGIADMGGGYEYIIDQLKEESHALVFVPFRDAVKSIAAHMQADGFEPEIMMGGLTPDEQRKRLQRAKSSGQPVIATIAYGESWDLETCCRTFFLGYDFNKSNLEQAEGRTRRKSSDHRFVSWQYLRYAGTIDEYYLARMSTERRDVNKVLTRGSDLIKAIKGELV